jgi:NADPH2:quinone reductase
VADVLCAEELTAADEARIGALVKKALPDPAAGSDEVLVDVDLSNITFVDTQIRAGRPPRPAMSAPLPAVLGNGVGGVVAAVGQGVDAAQVGRRVITLLRGTGGYAERQSRPPTR